MLLHTAADPALHLEDFRPTDGSQRHSDRRSGRSVRTELASTRAAESSETIRDRVIGARQRQIQRFQGDRIYMNAQMGPRHLPKHCALSAECEKIMESAVTKLGFSGAAATAS